MLGLLVPPEIHLALEGSPTEVARERLVAGVFPGVGSVRLVRTHLLQVYCSHVLLSCYALLPGVGDEVAALTERLPAHHALMRLLAWTELL